MFTLLKNLCRRTRSSFRQNICHQLQLLLAFSTVCIMTFAEKWEKGVDDFTICPFIFIVDYRVLSLVRFSFF